MLFPVKKVKNETQSVFCDVTNKFVASKRDTQTISVTEENSNSRPQPTEAYFTDRLHKSPVDIHNCNEKTSTAVSKVKTLFQSKFTKSSERKDLITSSSEKQCSACCTVCHNSNCDFMSNCGENTKR